MANISGLIIIIHQSFQQIPINEVIEALPPDWKLLDRKIIIVEPIMKNLGNETSIDWKSAARKQTEIWKSNVAPIIKEKENYRIVYFGLAHIPLAFHLGYLIGSTLKCEIFQRNHETDTWIYGSSLEDSNLPEFDEKGIPSDEVIAQGEVTYRFSTNYSIQEDLITHFADFPVAHIYRIASNPQLDSFTSLSGAQRAGKEFRKGLDEIKNKLPNISKVHLFAAVPVGVALEMGRQVSPTIHNGILIQIYNYQNKEHFPCFILQSLERETLVLTDDEKKQVPILRKELFNSLEGLIKPYIKKLESNKEPWHMTINSILEDSVFSESTWRNFPNLSGTNLATDILDLDIIDSSDFYKNGAWCISDTFLGAIIRRFGNDTDGILKAYRMFFFHEALHFSFQKLFSTKAQGIGRFPKVLEKADYEADVWAMFQEYAFCEHYNMLNNMAEREFFVDILQKAADTMWAFDVAESDPDEMQLRRIIRYLTIYFNLAQIQDRSVSTLKDLANCLGTTPIIDIKGLRLTSDTEGRIIASLTNFEASKLAIGVYHDNQVYTLGSIENSFQISDLILALNQRDSQAVTDFVAKVWDRIK